MCCVRASRSLSLSPVSLSGKKFSALWSLFILHIELFVCAECASSISSRVRDKDGVTTSESDLQRPSQLLICVLSDEVDCGIWRKAIYYRLTQNAPFHAKMSNVDGPWIRTRPLLLWNHPCSVANTLFLADTHTHTHRQTYVHAQFRFVLLSHFMASATRSQRTVAIWLELF